MKRRLIITVAILLLAGIALAAFFIRSGGIASKKAEQDFVAAYSGHKDFETIYPVIKEARAIVMKDPRHDGAYHSLAQSYYTLGAYDQARDALVQAIEIIPANDAYWSFLGKTYQAMKSYPEAAEAYRRALELDPNRTEYYIRLAWLYYFRFEGDEMQKSYDILSKGLELYPEDKDLLFDITRYYLYENKMEEFARYAQRYLKVDQSDPADFKKELEKYLKSNT
ncbi:tetratricopeptide repeat protein [Candidatus Uhrbacteria bacterium]|nr:tetratricopeptide repeat protein [Candidatus Uhrbacteria bacterium]